MYALIAVHAVLGIWGAIGFTEWFVAEPPWPRISNELFPRHILLMQWSLVSVAAGVFLGGYFAGWRYLPQALAAVYAAMAALCAVETFAYLQHDLRFAALAAEYAAYILIVAYLVRTGAGGRAARPTPGAAAAGRAIPDM